MPRLGDNRIGSHLSGSGTAARKAAPRGGPRGATQKMVRFLELCVSSLRRGHANLLCIVPNFVNVFGFPLGRVVANPLLYMPHRARKLTVRGPQPANVARACSRCALGISQELRNAQRRCGCSSLASVRVRGAGDPGTWRGTCCCQSVPRRLSTLHASDLIHQSVAIDSANISETCIDKGPEMMHCIILSSHCIDKFDELVEQQSLKINDVHRSRIDL